MTRCEDDEMLDDGAVFGCFMTRREDEMLDDCAMFGCLKAFSTSTGDGCLFSFFKKLQIHEFS